jgi:hypothetical protein
MKKMFLIIFLVFVSISSHVFAQMSGGQGGGMMGDGWWWGMNSGWFVMIIIAFLVILGVVYLMKRR